MEDKFKNLRVEAEKEIRSAISADSLEALRVKYLGRKSFLSSFSGEMSKLDVLEKPIAGRLLNQAKQFISRLLEEAKSRLAEKEEGVDPTFPGSKIDTGSIHPLTLVIKDICRVFERLGFEIQEGKETEDEWHNFQALNIPLDHPSRDAFDTFYLGLPASDKGKYLLRSHTSPSQIRLMRKRKPPLAFVVPGRVYRPDSVDASHSFMFHQIEGFAVGKEITFSHLKGVLMYFAKELFSEKVNIRLRPHFFPFTEPSAEMDISCIICKGKGCSVCKHSGWLEILGCGMINPKVLKACNINPKSYQGFAFGMGVERIAMLKYGINDIRLFYENDVKFLNQFYEI